MAGRFWSLFRRERRRSKAGDDDDGQLPDILNSLVQKSADPILLEFMRALKIHLEFSNMRTKLEKLTQASASFGRNGMANSKGKTNIKIRCSMAELRSLAFKTEHLLEDLRWEACHNKALIKRYRRMMVSNAFKPIILPRTMKKKIRKISRQLNAIDTEMSSLIPEDPMPLSQDSIVGREGSIQAIQQTLLNLDRGEADGLNILCVVGPRGVGKTILVQTIFDNQKVEEYFSLCIWVNVSRHFDNKRIMAQIIEYATCTPLSTPTGNMEILQSYLQDILHQKRFLIVLDEVCDDNMKHWEVLKASLSLGAAGSAILVTTRTISVAETLEVPSSCIIELEPMSNDEIWLILSRHAFSFGEHHMDERPDLVEIAQGVVQGCQGIPLVARFLGDLLHSKLSTDEWLSVAENNSWDVSTAVAMSYDHMPPNMKRCFALCTLFPENHEVDGNTLIQLWMANDMVWSSQSLSYFNREEPEDAGAKILDGLCSRLFMQEVSQADNGGTIYKVQSLVHDVAKSIIGKEFSILHSDKHPETILRDLHHLSVVGSSRVDIDIMLHNSLGIHTLLSPEEGCRLCVSSHDFWKSNSLRALDLHGLMSSSVPFNSIDMKHLRYLDLSRSWIVSLPEDFFMIYNLQTLRLSECIYLTHLPEKMRHMENLRHLYVDGCFLLRSLPPHMGQLSKLQTLTTYIVGEGDGYGIEEIKSLRIGGKLELYNLKNVQNKETAKHANLASKRNLSHLLLCWGMFIRDDDVETDNAEEVMEALQTPVGLQMLKVWRYPGSILPIWSPGHTLTYLIKLIIKDCPRCNKLPPVRYLPSLEMMHLEEMDSLIYICGDTSDDLSMNVEDMDGPTSTNVFGARSLLDRGVNRRIDILNRMAIDTIDVNCYSRSFWKLKKLILCNMQNLLGWQEDAGVEGLTIPVLEELRVINCPKLATIPIAPMLKNLTVEGSNKQDLCSLAPSSVKTEGPWCSVD